MNLNVVLVVLIARWGAKLLRREHSVAHALISLREIGIRTHIEERLSRGCGCSVGPLSTIHFIFW